MNGRLPGTAIQQDFSYEKHPRLREWMDRNFPQIDQDKTMENFIDWASDIGRLANDWEAAFRRIVKIGVTKKYDGIVVYKEGRSADPKWAGVIALAKQYGFREPHTHETHTAYTREFETWRDQQKRAPVIEFGPAIRNLMK